MQNSSNPPSPPNSNSPEDSLGNLGNPNKLGSPASLDPFSPINPVSEYIAALLKASSLSADIACHKVVEAEAAQFAPGARPWPRALQDVLARQGINSLYTHQALSTDLVRAGRHVLAATPTASGKSLIYNLPVLERCLANPETRALYLFPLKALAQDQLAAFERLIAHWPKESAVRAAIYDGDTSDHFRRKIRQNPPNVLITNPEMLHLAMLPFHEQWSEFWASLDFVVIDEVHTYRGLLGSHFSCLLQRLQRVCRHYGSQPSYIMCSATIGNPAELAQNLAGFTPEVVSSSGAPRGKRHFVFLNPEASPASTAIQLLRAALARNLRTIIYCQSRRMTELISLWAKEKAGPYADKISAYRAGFLPEERREIESRMERGDLLAVVSTSALELGIDIGGLDLCILVGYPGTVMSFLQRGGRVGRQGQESAVLFVAEENALDQYFIRQPEDFFSRPPEEALLNPHNSVIIARHLPCAAAELPLEAEGRDKNWLAAKDGAVARQAQKLVQSGELLCSACGNILYSSRKRPQRHVDLRGAGHTCNIVDEQGNNIGSIDGLRAWHETHPGAVYLHRGKSYVIESIDEAERIIRARQGKLPYYTRVRSSKETVILDVQKQQMLASCPMYFGRLRVTEQISGYERRCGRSGRLLGITPLSAPDFVFETEGFWFSLSEELQAEAEKQYLHFMGAIHALEHAAIGILPLLIMCDRNDLGGISTPMHPQVGRPAVFVYDGLPGGAGLARAAFAKGQEVLNKTFESIAHCACELGCPSCVHSPKCGSGNRPIDKLGALFLARALALHTKADNWQPAALSPKRPGARRAQSAPPEIVLYPELPHAGAPNILPGDCLNSSPDNLKLDKIQNFHLTGSDFLQPDVIQSDFGQKEQAMTSFTADVPVAEAIFASESVSSFGSSAPYLVLDVETQLSAAEVGGWHNAHAMRVSVAVLYDSSSDIFLSYTEDAMPELLQRLEAASLVVGFNLKRFDYTVLSRYAQPGKAFFKTLPTLDMLEVVHKQLGYRLSLDNIAGATLNAGKTADGLDALRWWKQGQIEKIRAYCESDVRLTRDVYLHGKQHGFVLFTNKSGAKVRAPVSF